MVEFTGGKKVYAVCEKIFRDLYKTNETFKILIDRDKYVNIFRNEDRYYIGSDEVDYDIPSAFKGVEVEGLSNRILSITFSDIYKYYSESAYLYGRGIALFFHNLEGTEIVTLDTIVNPFKYPSKGDVLIRKGDTKSWSKSVSVPKKLGVILKGLKFTDDYEVARVFMDGENLTLGLYSPVIPPREIVYGENPGIDKLLEMLVSYTEGMKSSVNEVYWFLKGNYSSMRAKKTSNGELSIVVS